MHLECKIPRCHLTTEHGKFIDNRLTPLLPVESTLRFIQSPENLVHAGMRMEALPVVKCILYWGSVVVTVKKVNKGQASFTNGIVYPDWL